MLLLAYGPCNTIWVQCANVLFTLGVYCNRKTVNKSSFVELKMATLSPFREGEMRTLCRVEGGVLFRRGARDLGEPPMGFAVLTTESPRSLSLSNRRSRLARVDVMLRDKDMGGVRPDMFCRDECDVASKKQNVSQRSPRRTNSVVRLL